MFYLTREYAADRLSSVYSAFCDPAAGTCSFDTELFREYLTYWKSLPTEAEYGTKSPLGQVEVTEQYRYYMDGTVPMKEFDLNTPLQMRYELGTLGTAFLAHDVPCDRQGKGSRAVLVVCQGVHAHGV